MRDEYTKILDEMIINENVINQYTDGRKLLHYLHGHDVIDFQEKEELKLLGPMECTQHLIKVVLKSRKDEDMIYFLNSLRDAKYDDASCWLKKKLEITNLTNQCVQTFDEKRNADQFIWFKVREPTVSFIGREVQLNKLHNEMLQSKKKVGADAKKIVITGLGGIGKTQLALRYVQQYSQQYDNNIVWINAESDATLRYSFINLAKNLNVNIKNANGVEKETARIFEDVYTHLSMVKCLFVFDNVDEPLKDEFYPNGQHQIYILITSRYQKWGKIKVLHLDNFSRKEASDFIRITLKSRTNIHSDQITNLAKTLHFFPLALRQATAYINEESKIKKTFSIDHYIKKYNESKEKLLNYKFVSDYSNKYLQTTFTPWKTTIDKLNGNTNDVINFLDCISYFACEQIDKQIFIQNEDDEEIGVAIQLLLKEYSLVTEENGLLNVHPLVQEVTRLHIKDKNVEKKTFTTVCRLILSYFKQLERSNNYFKQKILLLHSEKLLLEMKNWLIQNPKQQKHVEQESIKNLLIQMSNAYNNIGEQRQNKSVLEQLLSIKIEHYEVAITLRSLGNAYGALGLPEMKKTLLEKALVVIEKHYGTDHYQVAMTLKNLSNAYGTLGQPEMKKNLLEKALAIDEKHYGSNHYQVAITSTNLGNAYGALGQPEKQKTLLKKALAIEEKHYGLDHYEVAITLTNLGNAYGALGQPEMKKPLLEKALVILEKHYGPGHYQVAKTLTNLGNAYGDLRQPEMKKTLLEKALAMNEKHYGSDHYEVAITLTNLGNVYGDLGQPEKQKTLLEKALAMKEKHYGSDHYEVAITLSNLGNAYGRSGQPEKQKTLLEKALMILEKH